MNCYKAGNNPLRNCNNIERMYVTRPVSLYKRSPENLSLPPPEGPNSGYLVLFDEESETPACFGLCTTKHLPFPQNKDLTVWATINTPENDITPSLYNDVLFIPVLNQPLSSNRYYVIRREGKQKGLACTSSKGEDEGTFCCCTYIRDAKPTPFDPSDIYQQFEITRKKYLGLSAKSVAPDGFPPNFLRRNYWGISMRKAPHYQLDEAPGIKSSLRARLPGFNFPISRASSDGAVVVGKWYCPFMFVKEGNVKLKDQMKLSTFYEVTLEQRWDKIFRCENVEINDHRKTLVIIDVVIEREEVFVEGRKAVWEERSLEDGVVWFKSCDAYNGGKVESLGMSMKILERMKWEQERVGWVDGSENQVRIERREESEWPSGWSKFGCYVLVERFVLKRMNKSVALAYDFKHTHHIRCKWE